MTGALDYMGSGVKASTRLKASEVLQKVPGADSITHVWGYDPNPGNTEHHTGLAADFMVFGDAALGWRIYNYLWDNRARLGVVHIIYRQGIISTVVSPGMRRPMADRGNSTENHMDHVHVLFLDKAWTATAPKPKPKPVKVTKPTTILRVGMRSNSIRSLQKELNRVFPAYSNLVVDGNFGPKTEWVVKEFQQRSDLNPDGEVGPKTRAKLRALGITF